VRTLPAIRWAFGVTTVPQRMADLLPRTLASLAAGGFVAPRLLVDGAKDWYAWERAFPGHEITTRQPNVRTAGNWVLMLWELYVRDPFADRYAVFQDDFVTYQNLRTYLEKVPYPTGADPSRGPGYLNLYTFPSNQEICPKDSRGREVVGWYESRPLRSGPEGWQSGRGAVALVFSRDAVVTLLSARHLVERFQDKHRGHRAIDGGIVTAMNKAGWREYVHHPSLVQHTGDVSAMGNKAHPKAVSFRGEGFDALSLLTEGTP
jgi:hypothetical protein